jgi:AcrR family transcriptional regulator
MPRTRHQLERDKKVAEILDAAERRLRSDGYPALSVAAIARQLKLAPNSIYWYFPTKDDLFVATVRHMLEGIVSRKDPAQKSLERRVLWFVDQLSELDHLRVALYERSRDSDVVARFVEELDANSRELVVNTLAGEVPDEDVEVAAEALVATVAGASLRRLSKKDRARVVSYTLSRFTAG